MSLARSTRTLAQSTRTLARPTRTLYLRTRQKATRALLGNMLEKTCLQPLGASERIGVAMNKEICNIAAHVGEWWCAMRLWTL